MRGPVLGLALRRVRAARPEDSQHSAAGSSLPVGLSVIELLWIIPLVVSVGALAFLIGWSLG